MCGGDVRSRCAKPLCARFSLRSVAPQRTTPKPMDRHPSIPTWLSRRFGQVIGKSGPSASPSAAHASCALGLATGGGGDAPKPLEITEVVLADGDLLMKFCRWEFMVLADGNLPLPLEEAIVAVLAARQ